MEFSGQTEICARLRISGQNSTTYAHECNSINVILSGNQNNPNNNEEEEGEETEDDDENPTQNNVVNNSVNSINSNLVPNLIEISNNQKPTKITLASSSKKQSEESVELTKSYKTRIGVIYFFVGLCVLIVVLMALRKL